MTLVRSLVRSSVSPLAISLLGGGALSLGARVDSELEQLIEAGGTVSQIEVQDLTSMRAATDGSGSAVSVGDSVGYIVDSSQLGGKTVAAYAAANGISDITTIPGNHWSAPSDTARPILMQDGDGKYFLRFDGIDDQLTLTDTFGSDMTVVMGMKTSDDKFVPFYGQGGSFHGLAFEQGSTSSAFVAAVGSSPEYRLDGSAFAPADRAEAWTGVADGQAHVFSSLVHDLSTWTEINIGDYGVPFSFAGDITYLAIFPSDPDTLALNEQLAAEVAGVTLP